MNLPLLSLGFETGVDFGSRGGWGRVLTSVRLCDCSPFLDLGGFAALEPRLFTSSLTAAVDLRV